jgi:hypothetical protein
MKNILLFTVFSVFLTVGAMSQVNLLSNGDCEELGVWQIVSTSGSLSDYDIEFGNANPTPKYGDGNNLKVSWNNVQANLDLYIFQVVTLTVGKKYEISGAFKDAATNSDATYFWHQILMMPVNGFNDMSNGPDKETFGEDQSIILGMSSGWRDDNEGGLGQDTTYSFCSKNYGGAFTGSFNDGTPQGDTTVFTVPSTYPTSGDPIELGEAGTEVDFYFILYWGQWGEDSWDNTYSFVFDEYSIHEYGVTGISDDIEVVSDNLSVYPNPVRESLYVTCDNGISSVSIVNIVGQKVLRFNNIYHHRAEINTSGLDKGIYFIRVTDAHGANSSRKIIKE